MSSPSVGVWFFVAWRELERRVLEGMRRSGFGDVTLAQARVIARIPPEGARLTELAEMAQVTKQTAGVLVDRLVANGYLERLPDPGDGRARIVHLAARGRRAFARAEELQAQVEDEWAAHLGASDMARLRAIMARLREVTDPWSSGSR